MRLAVVSVAEIFWIIRKRMELWRVHRRTLAIATLLAAMAHAVEIRVATFNIGATFGDTFFIYSLGDPGTSDHDTVRDILARIDADVVALQEIHSVDLQGNPDDLEALAASLGYPYLNVPPVTGVFDTTLRVVFMSRFPFLESTSIAPPDGAKDMTRRHALVRVDVPDTDNDPLLVSPHMKAGTLLADRFRRAVEMRRLVNELATRSVSDEDNFVILGDFNPSSNQATFNEEPSDMPGTYVLGNDITFPVTYFVNPVDYFSVPAAIRLDSRQLDGSPSTFNTSQSGGPTLDLILVSPAIAEREFAAEIYNSTLDVSNDSGLPKAGDPLAANTSAIASDHYAVFADLELDPPSPYVFHQPGDTVADGFDTFTGTRAPAPWTTTGGGEWLGIDDGTSNQRGWRAYGVAGETAPGYLSDGSPAQLSAVFMNDSPQPITALQFSLDAKQWNAVTGGAADSFAVELVTPGQIVPLPDLTFTADTTLPTGSLAGGAPVFLTTIARNLWIEPGGTFDLRVSFQPDPDPGVPPDDVFINEFHYDNDSTDTGEFVEVVVGPGYSGDLTDISLLLYNGSNSAVYDTHPLDSFDNFQQPQITGSGHRIYHKSIPGIQNGAPDGLALVAGSTVLQFISYEGSFTATNGPAAGLLSAEIAVSQNGSETIGDASLGLAGEGGFAADFIWTKFTGIPHSPGLPNAGQSFTNPAKPPQGLAFDNLSVTYLTDNDLDGDPDLTDPDDDNDGQSDAYETAFGSDPSDGGSRFEPALVRNGAGMELTFPGVQGIDYTVESSGTLEDWNELTTVAGEDAMISVPLPMDEPAMFFRVRSQGPAN
jgi:endonuclease/exonuclease/phosphatase family metal-dependent hydrolase